MTNTRGLPSIDNHNDWADYWRYQIGVNAIPVDTQNKKPVVEWAQYQDNPIPEWQHDKWKSEDAFLKGMAIIPGKVWHNPDRTEYYMVFIDLDNLKAINEVAIHGLENLATHALVEQHADDQSRAHVYFYSKYPFAKKSSDKLSPELVEEIAKNDIPAIEVKGLGEHGIAFCSPSYHKNGQRYKIIGTFEPECIEGFEKHIDSICTKYGIKYLDNYNGNGKAQLSIEGLFKPDTKIYEGHNRHEALLRVIESLLVRNRNILSYEQIIRLAVEWNNQHCLPQLEEREFNKQWKDAIKFVEGNNFSSNDSNNNNNESSSGNPLQKPSRVIEALKLAQENCRELFQDQYGKLYAAISVNEHIETLPLNRSRFRSWLSKMHYTTNGSILNGEDITNVLNILKAKAEFGGKRKVLNLRVSDIGTEPYTIYYDLTDTPWNVVRVSSENWGIEKAPVIFRRYTNQQAQVLPIREYGADIFDKFMGLTNVKNDENKLLLKCYIISLFIPHIPKPVLMLHGEQGSAKSTLQELIKLLVDPSIMRTLTFPRDINELIQKLAHNYIAYFDNVSEIKEWISDVLCRAVTGSGFSKRELFTDDDDIIYNFKRCIGFNGINLGATKADLLDRGLIIELERIPKERRRKIEDIWIEFEGIKPPLLGYIFDILVKVLKIKKGGGLELEKKGEGHPRMADFSEIAEIISRSMEYPDNLFLKTYNKNIGIQIEEALEANPVASTIIKFVSQAENNYWIGTATQLLNELDLIAEQELKIKVSKVHGWPKSPASLSRRIKEVKTPLREVGIIIERPKDTYTNTKLVEISKISPEAPVSPEDKNQAQKEHHKSGDILSGNGLSSEISPEINRENQA